MHIYFLNTLPSQSRTSGCTDANFALSIIFMSSFSSLHILNSRALHCVIPPHSHKLPNPIPSNTFTWQIPNTDYLRCYHQPNICTLKLKMVREKWSTAINWCDLKLVTSNSKWSVLSRQSYTSQVNSLHYSSRQLTTMFLPSSLVHDFIFSLRNGSN